MDLKRDDHGRPVGLNWPDRPPVAPEVIAKQTKAVKKTASRKGVGGRPLHERCGKNGDGPHLMSETGKALPRGGRFCTACRKEYKKAYQKKQRQDPTTKEQRNKEQRERRARAKTRKKAEENG